MRKSTVGLSELNDRSTEVKRGKGGKVGKGE